MAIEVFNRYEHKNDEDEQEFINELRCRNGNLNIILAVSAPIK